MTASNFAGRYVLVTGGTGFIGRHLVRRLIDDGARVVTYARGAARIAGAEHVRGDVRDTAAVTALVERRFDTVFHLAGASGQRDGDREVSRETNCGGVINVLEAIRRFAPQTTLCFASSRLVYGRTERLPVDEDHPEQPLTAYGDDKRAGEAYCSYYAARWDVRTVALRLSNPYGPHAVTGHHRYNVANWMIDELCAGRPVTVFGRGEQLRDYIYIEDAVDAMTRAASTDAAFGQVFNVGSGAGTPLVEFVRAGMLAAGSGSIAFARWPADDLRIETGDYVADVSRIGAALGWAPRVSVMEGVTRTVAAQRRALVARKTSTARPAQPEIDELEAAA
jgi:nucleoside-diphosphate-sugar epimerase